jgi:predicted NAD/FAD-binding protein
MPAYFLFSYLSKLGLLEGDENAQWRIVRGGGFRIISQLVSSLINPVRFQTEVVKIFRRPEHIEIITKTGEKETFDAVILAVHADDALKLLEKPTPSEEQILSSFGYEEFDVVIHTDERFIQTPLKEPSSWYIQVSDTPEKIPPVITWNLNHLQQLAIKTNLFLTFAPQGNNVPKEKTMTVLHRKAPKPTWKMLSVQKRFTEINGINRTYFCGDYWGCGTLEDSLESALEIVPLIEKQQARAQTI